MNVDPYIRMSIIDGAIAIVRHRQKYPEITIDEAMRQLRNGPVYLARYNYPAAVEFAELIGWDVFSSQNTRKKELQSILYQIAVTAKPFWAQISMFGRERVRALLDEDTEQCLRCAGLFDLPVTPDIYNWWDKVASVFRSEEDRMLLDIGRAGERLSIEYEEKRLRSLGLNDLHPIWISIEDNTAGYDILSYDIDVLGEVHEIKIEVKTSSLSPVRFILSRNEWELAKRTPDFYRIHAWCLEDLALSTLYFDTFANHLPRDGETGKWLTAEFLLDKLSPSH